MYIFKVSFNFFQITVSRKSLLAWTFCSFQWQCSALKCVSFFAACPPKNYWTPVCPLFSLCDSSPPWRLPQTETCISLGSSVMNHHSVATVARSSHVISHENMQQTQCLLQCLTQCLEVCQGYCLLTVGANCHTDCCFTVNPLMLFFFFFFRSSQL